MSGSPREDPSTNSFPCRQQIRLNSQWRNVLFAVTEFCKVEVKVESLAVERPLQGPPSTLPLATVSQRLPPGPLNLEYS